MAPSSVEPRPLPRNAAVDSSARLPTPARTGAAFSFPYATPYSIQLDIMTALFEAIEGRKVAVFESPTGTGKSLSLICATFTWLRDNEKRREAIALDEGDGGPDAEPAWVRRQAAERKRRDLTRHEEELKERIAAVKVKEAELRKRALRDAKLGSARFAKKQRLDESGTDDDVPSDDDAFLPSDSPADASSSASGQPAWHALTSSSDDDANLSPAVRALMAQFSGPSTSDLEELPETTPKVIYASRTHSQLTQFVAELKKTSFGKDVQVKEGSMGESEAIPAIRTIPLGSRKQMCINEDVQKMGAKAGAEAMNEACRELASSKEKSKRCQFLPPTDAIGRAQVLDFRDRALAQVRDIEDLVQVGKEMKTCPYYAGRTAARQAELVTLPYNLLLQKTARESLGISLDDAVILIDESHNLIDTILGVYSCTITSTQLTVAKAQINEYLRRFASRLRGESEMHLRTLRRLLEGLERVAKQWAEGARSGKEEVWTASKMVEAMGGNLDTINFGKLESFLKESHIARKVSGYAEKVAERASKAKEEGPRVVKGARSTTTGTTLPAGPLPPSAIAAMHNIESFVLSLSNRAQDGRVLLSLLPAAEGRSLGPYASMAPVVSLKYQLLNPSESFSSLITAARAIVMAGGTMEPISDVRKQLLPSLPNERWSTFSCGHIVPSENLFCSIVPSGPRGIPFDFTYGKRGDTALLDDLGNAIANFAALIPHGVVVFLPSYKLLDELVARWKETGTWTRLQSRKALFTEPKLASEVEATLQAYTSAIEDVKTASTVTGSLLFAVVGAKLSEGINFSDRLARAVIMVGMPFPNSQSPELMERMKYVRSLKKKSALEPASLASREDPGQALYLSLCLKAVNQSIGRAIRHQGDFASLLLLDGRYARKEIRNGLPGWIRDEVKVQEGFGGAMKDLGAWWRAKRANNMV
ncbi:DNA repair helicase [Microstroma glucosiphilum]|uniref:ATP-dependent DNA helicase CHL1 n=1 Tax=Pseudomicrostroma glucosiphilum TaxID=1684307 RepID=A0A316UHP8_9BASI|nr:DNA repair helicase [Pseudomicrostroma glucosiphilum]PWN23453.1 DNA repair helicase [Pseudomicrostroma glucosiphilum]